MPSKFLKSPYVQHRSINPQLNKKKTLDAYADERIIAYYADEAWEKICVPHRLLKWPLSDFPREFWQELFNDINDGWLTTPHMDLWCSLLREFCTNSSKWSIMEDSFFTNVTTKGTYSHPLSHFAEFANGVKGKAWWEIDYVYFPINIPQAHWLLGELDVKNWTLKLYDSITLSGMVSLQNQFKKISDFLYVFLNEIGYWDKCGYNRPKENVKLTLVEAENVPQQATGSRDCGVYACMFMEQLVYGESIILTKNISDVDVAYAFRSRMAQIFFGSRNVKL